MNLFNQNYRIQIPLCKLQLEKNKIIKKLIIKQKKKKNLPKRIARHANFTYCAYTLGVIYTQVVN